ncbi:MAG: glycosyltransferase family 4 protein [Phycisphaerales bacterium]|nr:MAG: glycosyltransferase family 4 protein [Phycisphaerales bacterium]
MSDSRQSSQEAPQGRVLVVTQEFYPATSVGALRPAKFCKYLPEFGWIPRVLTTTEDCLGARDGSLDPEMVARTEVIRAPMRPLPRALQVPLETARAAYLRWRDQDWLLRRTASNARYQSFWWVRALPDLGIPWIRSALKVGREAVRECDCIYSTYPTGSAHYVALRLSRQFGLPWIADFRDPWSQGTIVAHMASWKRAIVRRAERASVRQCNFVVSTTDAITRRFRQTYPKEHADKFHTIRNGYDAWDFPPEEEILASRGDAGIFRAAYFGTLYAGRDPAGLFTALRNLLESAAIDEDRFRLELYGPPPPKLQREIHTLGLEKVVRVEGLVPYREGLKLMCQCDLLVVIGSPRTDDLCIATKLYEYLYARRPILALVPPGPIRDFVTDTRAGHALDGNDVEAIMRYLRDCYEAFKAGQSQRLTTPIPEHYGRRYQAGQLAQLLSAARLSGG